MSKKSPSTRAVARRKAPAPEPARTREEISATLEADEFAPELPEKNEPRRDPAQVVAEVVLEGILSGPGAGPNLDDLRAPGAVIAVVVKSADWLDPVRRAWRRGISGEQLTQKADGYPLPHAAFLLGDRSFSKQIAGA